MREIPEGRRSNAMGEIRQDVTTGEWVVIAPERGKRPHEWRRDSRPSEFSPSIDATCPFCPGNEGLLPDILVETQANNSFGWGTRVVPNKFPAFSSGASQNDRTRGIYIACSSDGQHEVIVETPDHNADLAIMSDADVTRVISTYRERFATLLSQSRFKHVVLFRNHGSAAGASLSHPHSQLIALGVGSPRHRLMDKWAHDHFQSTGLCIFCEMLEFERKEISRVVSENSEFIAIVPFAAISPFELWLVPKGHQPSFSELSPKEEVALAEILKQLLKAYRTLLGDPPYSFVIESGLVDNLAAPHRHWRLRMVPTLVKRGGFELGTNLPINPSAPEDDAAALRGCLHANEKGVQ